ncbi:MAG: hypothetical protein GF349_00815 [Candidatus Magasanikbacteria bacterium]|nr:hypothetical protein [Candidatus Magasanikbacteria bacterium]
MLFGRSEKTPRFSKYVNLILHVVDEIWFPLQKGGIKMEDAKHNHRSAVAKFAGNFNLGNQGSKIFFLVILPYPQKDGDRPKKPLTRRGSIAYSQYPFLVETQKQWGFNKQGSLNRPERRRRNGSMRICTLLKKRGESAEDWVGGPIPTD